MTSKLGFLFIIMAIASFGITNTAFAGCSCIPDAGWTAYDTSNILDKHNNDCPGKTGAACVNAFCMQTQTVVVETNPDGTPKKKEDRYKKVSCTLSAPHSGSMVEVSEDDFVTVIPNVSFLPPPNQSFGTYVVEYD